MNIKPIIKEVNLQLWRDIRSWSHNRNIPNNNEKNELRFISFGTRDINLLVEVLIFLELNYSIISSTIIMSHIDYEKLDRYLNPL